MTVIEIRPHPWGWKVFEAPGAASGDKEATASVSQAFRFMFLRAFAVLACIIPGRSYHFVVAVWRAKEAETT
jgi:hypothetical protein